MTAQISKSEQDERGLWATTRTKGRQAFTAIVRALKASQALGKAALTESRYSKYLFSVCILTI